MVDSLTLYNAIEHSVKMVDKEGNTHIGRVTFYESEWDSGYGVAIIGLDTEGTFYKETDIESIEILD